MQSFGDNLLIDFNLLIDRELSLDSWFILYTLANNKKDLLNKYTDINKFKLKDLLKLEDQGYIILKNKENISIDSIRLTIKGKELVTAKGKSENDQLLELFAELRNTYPKRVPAENGAFRPLHGDLTRCKKLYHKILFKDGSFDIQLHKNILKSIDKEVQERIKGKNLPYMQNLATYLHQQNYTQYFDVEVGEIKDRGDDI